MISQEQPKQCPHLNLSLNPHIPGLSFCGGNPRRKHCPDGPHWSLSFAGLWISGCSQVQVIILTFALLPPYLLPANLFPRSDNLATGCVQFHPSCSLFLKITPRFLGSNSVNLDQVRHGDQVGTVCAAGLSTPSKLPGSEQQEICLLQYR